MSAEERLKKIEEHFASITLEEFEHNLELSGIGVIQSCGEQGMVLSPIHEEAKYSSNKGKVLKWNSIVDQDAYMDECGVAA